MTESILVVEDNLKLAKYLRENLIAQGYDVSVEPRGDKAVFRIIRENPKLVILDIMLPGMDGQQICRTVRNDYQGKILILTALNDTEKEVSSLNFGADDFLAKPFETDVLNARIAALFRRPTAVEPPNKILFDNLEIDLIKKEVSLASKKIELKPSEFELLILLAKNHDRTLDRNNIMLSLRGRAYDGLDRSIDLRISYLRKKLNDSIRDPYRIKTIRGKGYVLISTAWGKS